MKDKQEIKDQPLPELDIKSPFHFIKSIQKLTGLKSDEANTLLWILDMWNKKKSLPYPGDFELTQAPQIKEKPTKPPKYVMIKNTSGKLGSAMRFDSGKQICYRNAGCWSLGFVYKNGKWLGKSVQRETKHLNGLELVEVTEAEWRNDNRGHI